MIQIVAKLRRVAAFSAVFASLSLASTGAARAQSQPPAPADTTSKPAPADTTAKPATPPATSPAPATSTGAQSAMPSTPASSGTAKATSTGKSKKAPKTSNPKSSKPKASKAAAAGATAAAVPKPHGEPRKLESVYAKGANWLSLRFGYANRAGELSGDGYLGYGIAYSRMLNKRYAFAAGINHDVVGHFASQIDESVSYTGEFQKVFNWSGEMRPYLGLGGGFYFRKMYRTESDYNTTTTGGAHVSIGLTSQLDEKHVIGFETRVAWLNGRTGVENPTFGPGQATETIYTAKVTWALAY